VQSVASSGAQNSWESRSRAEGGAIAKRTECPDVKEKGEKKDNESKEGTDFPGVTIINVVLEFLQRGERYSD